MPSQGAIQHLNMLMTGRGEKAMVGDVPTLLPITPRMA